MHRELTPDDFGDLCDLLRGMHAESPFSKFPIEVNRASFVLRRLLELPEGVIYRQGLVDGTGLYGVLLAEVTSHTFMDFLMARDVFFYVTPSGRGNAGAVRSLVRDYERWAKEKGAQVVAFEISAGIADERACKLMELLGYGGAARLMSKGVG